jgi:DivIVA domain-containing protein
VVAFVLSLAGVLVVGGLLFLGGSLLLGRGETQPPAETDRSPVELPDDRPVTAADVRALRISVAVRGYRMTEVDWLLDQFAQTLDERDEQIAALRAELADGAPGPASGAAAPQPPSAERPAAEPPADEPPADEPAPDEPVSDEPAPDERPSEESPSGEYPGDEHPVEGGGTRRAPEPDGARSDA